METLTPEEELEFDNWLQQQYEYDEYEHLEVFDWAHNETDSFHYWTMGVALNVIDGLGLLANIIVLGKLNLFQSNKVG